MPKFFIQLHLSFENEAVEDDNKIEKSEEIIGKILQNTMKFVLTVHSLETLLDLGTIFGER